MLWPGFWGTCHSKDEVLGDMEDMPSHGWGLGVMRKMSPNGEVLGDIRKNWLLLESSPMLAIVRILVSVGHSDMSHQEWENRGQGHPWQRSWR